MTRIKVNLHGHIAPSFGAYWLERTGLAGKNLAEVVTDKCIEKGLGIYALTSEEGGHGVEHCEERGKYVFEQARQSKDYELGKLDNVAFVIRRKRDGKEVYFIEGQTMSVRGEGRECEMLTFGSSSVPYGMNFQDTFAYLSDNGLPVIPEHALCETAGGIGEENLRRYGERFLALEHNAQMALPIAFKFVPKYKDFTRAQNSKVREIANELRLPVVANDDSNWPTYIGAAYNEFNRGDISFGNGRDIVNSLVKGVRDRRFEPYLGHVSTPNWMNWVVWELLVREMALGCKKRWERKHL